MSYNPEEEVTDIVPKKVPFAFLYTNLIAASTSKLCEFEQMYMPLRVHVHVVHSSYDTMYSCSGVLL